MAQNLIGALPFPPLVLFDEGRPFALNDLHGIITERTGGVSICIRYPEGPAKRGGYFFHFEPSESAGAFVLYDFEKRRVAKLTAESFVKFINHCTGRVFDEASFTLCQTVLNFLKDDEPEI